MRIFCQYLQVGNVCHTKTCFGQSLWPIHNSVYLNARFVYGITIWHDLCLQEFFRTSTLFAKAEKSLSDHRQMQSIYYLHSLVQNFKICKDAPLIPWTFKQASDTVLLHQKKNSATWKCIKRRGFNGLVCEYLQHKRFRVECQRHQQLHSLRVFKVLQQEASRVLSLCVPPDHSVQKPLRGAVH